MFHSAVLKWTVLRLTVRWFRAVSDMRYQIYNYYNNTVANKINQTKASRQQLNFVFKATMKGEYPL